MGSQDSLAGTATGYGLDGRGIGVRVDVGAKIFLVSTSCRPVLGPTKPPIKWVPWTSSPGVKRPRREVDHSPLSSTEVEKVGAIPHSPHKSSWRSF
jgi:hypothetical protein